MQNRSASTNPRWALAYLRGQAGGFARGNVRPAALKSAVALAERHGVTAEQIRAALTDAGGDGLAIVSAPGDRREANDSRNESPDVRPSLAHDRRRKRRGDRDS